ncbi:Hypothetical predicted protein [Podarcis lilfordi]|uniref:Uncharacterized protein n=1 Tax=Podarcis lilfordi TaxID=74358 RepID=A0AA35NZM6_9SAUR|nr:Hypothetical predicted protein [Podarcis lilfordi]
MVLQRWVKLHPLTCSAIAPFPLCIFSRHMNLVPVSASGMCLAVWLCQNSTSSTVQKVELSPPPPYSPSSPQLGSLIPAAFNCQLRSGLYPTPFWNGWQQMRAGPCFSCSSSNPGPLSINWSLFPQNYTPPPKSHSPSHTNARGALMSGAGGTNHGPITQIGLGQPWSSVCEGKLDSSNPALFCGVFQAQMVAGEGK